ncbi:MAG: hypothetical protein JWN49_415 [Parcubacteria group bacterium]|nr:hypothetical protein [Parcubacteria group bacterium]
MARYGGSLAVYGGQLGLRSGEKEDASIGF